ncbi:hypothetical protein GWI33_010299 [Rhynchophorus ferrugineus]|uniref:Uncharacterized protein n=1 Tax=Rhynchophorus ferrugineus TaxID=354439 RepID=A0A834IR51_RHYFE|nr:hypothetical protein GWI33_010299 [Rhynchophorus ferrugineus]
MLETGNKDFLPSNRSLKTAFVLDLLNSHVPRPCDKNSRQKVNGCWTISYVAFGLVFEWHSLSGRRWRLHAGFRQKRKIRVSIEAPRAVGTLRKVLTNTAGTHYDVLAVPQEIPITCCLAPCLREKGRIDN